MSDVITTQDIYEATMCPAQIVAPEPTNILKLPFACARHTGKRI